MSPSRRAQLLKLWVLYLGVTAASSFVWAIFSALHGSLVMYWPMVFVIPFGAALLVATAVRSLVDEVRRTI